MNQIRDNSLKINREVHLAYSFFQEPLQPQFAQSKLPHHMFQVTHLF